MRLSKTPSSEKGEAKSDLDLYDASNERYEGGVETQAQALGGIGKEGIEETGWKRKGVVAVVLDRFLARR